MLFGVYCLLVCVFVVWLVSVCCLLAGGLFTMYGFLYITVYTGLFLLYWFAYCWLFGVVRFVVVCLGGGYVLVVWLVAHGDCLDRFVVFVWGF